MRLDLEKYCYKCDKFQPIKTKMYAGNGIVETVVNCKNQKRCLKIEDKIRKEINNGLDY